MVEQVLFFDPNINGLQVQIRNTSFFGTTNVKSKSVDQHEGAVPSAHGCVLD